MPQINKEPTIFITTIEAREIVKEKTELDITKVTMLTWINKYKLGRKIGGRYQVNKQQLLEFLNHEMEV